MSDQGTIDGFLSEALRGHCNSDHVIWPANGDGAWNKSDVIDLVWDRIDYHGLAAMLHLQPAQLSSWPAILRQRIADETRIIFLWEATHKIAAEMAIENLASAGIEVVVMKGTALAYSLYQSPELRRRGDSDILVRPDDLDIARSILRDCGWSRQQDPHGLYFQESWAFESTDTLRHVIDLHWQASDRPVLQSVLAIDDIFDSKRPLPGLSSHAYCPAPTFTLIHCILNQQWHFTHGYWTQNGRTKGARRLIWLQDLDLLMRSFGNEDWSQLISVCRAAGIGPLIADSLAAARGSLGTPLPEPNMTQLAAIPLNPDIAAYLAVGDNLSEFWLDLRTSNSWRRRANLIAVRAFPPRAHLQKKYPLAIRWPTPLLQARSLIGAGLRTLQKAIAR